MWMRAPSVAATRSASRDLFGPLKMMFSPGTPSRRAFWYSISEITSAREPSWWKMAQMASR